MDLRSAIKVKAPMSPLRMCCEVVRLAREAGRRAQIAVFTAFGCPFDGEGDPKRVIDMAKVRGRRSGGGGDCGRRRRREPSRCCDLVTERARGDRPSAAARAFS